MILCSYRVLDTYLQQAHNSQTIIWSYYSYYYSHPIICSDNQTTHNSPSFNPTAIPSSIAHSCPSNEPTTTATPSFGCPSMRPHHLLIPETNPPQLPHPSLLLVQQLPPHHSRMKMRSSMRTTRISNWVLF
jgi:hypothetical protein